MCRAPSLTLPTESFRPAATLAGVAAPIHGAVGVSRRGAATCPMKAVKGLHVGLTEPKSTQPPGHVPVFLRPVSRVSPKSQPRHLADRPHLWRGESRTGCTLVRSQQHGSEARDSEGSSAAHTADCCGLPGPPWGLFPSRGRIRWLPRSQ